MGYPGYPGYPPNGPYPPRPARWPWILGALVAVATLAVVVIAAGIIVLQYERSRSAAPGTEAPVAETGPHAPPVPNPTTAPADPQAQALATLRARAAADQPYVGANLADRWVPQLSAKQPGLVAADVDGRMVTWTTGEILAQNDRFRQQYSGARLVWSNDWSTFDLQGWWITLADVSFADPDSANAWCDVRAIGPDHCFAKLVSDTRGSAGTTKYRN